jgi:hypothetical protein
VQKTGEVVTFVDLLNEWGLVEYCFRCNLGLSLKKVWKRMSWREFASLVAGLLADDTLLRARFAPEPEPTTPTTSPPEFD